MHLLTVIARLQSIRSELGEVYTSQLLFTFAMSLVGVFLPVYILQLSFTLPVALLFMAVLWAGIGLLSPLAAAVASSIGLKHTILLSTPLQIAFLSLLLFAPPTSALALFPIALLGGLANAFYWTPLHIEFVSNADRLHRIQEVGSFIALPRIAAAAAPFFAGILAAVAGFTPLFALACFLLIASALPLFLTHDYRPRLRFPFHGRFLHRPAAAHFFLQGVVAMGEAVLWPLWIYLTFGDLVAVGAAAALSALAIAMFTLLASRGAAKPPLFRLGCLLVAVVWLSRLFSPALPLALVLSFLGGLGFTLINFGIYAAFAASARRNPPQATVFREAWLNFGHLLPAAALALLLPDPVAGFPFVLLAALALAVLPPRQT